MYGFPGRRSNTTAAALAAAMLSGCAGSSEVSGTVTTADLATRSKAVAVMRLGSPNPNCKHVAVLLGVRDGSGYRRHAPVKVINVRGLEKAPIGEVELDPGEYHVVAYSCVAQAGPNVVGDKEGTNYRTSFAHFTLAPGEIVNLGYLHLDAARAQHSGFGKALKAEVEVTDWPIEEIERYKAERPELAAQMKTRLMLVGSAPDTPEEQSRLCDRWRNAKAEGLAQSVPPECKGT